MVYEDYLKSNSPRMQKSATGLSKRQFLLLGSSFEKVYHEIQNERLKSGEIRKLPKGGAYTQLDEPRKMLFFVLVYLKNYCTLDFIGLIFGFSSGHAHDHLMRLLPILQRTLSSLEVLPKRTLATVEELKQLVEKFGEIIADGVECPCVKPGEEVAQKAHYSGKKKRHTVKSLIISNSERRILLVYFVIAGSVHDYKLFKQLFDPKIEWFKDVAIHLDLGFFGANSDYGPNARLPHKRQRKSKKNLNPRLSKKQVKSNSEHARFRVSVEHAIGGMKTFHCLMHRIRNHLPTLIDSFFWLSAGLWNFKITNKS